MMMKAALEAFYPFRAAVVLQFSSANKKEIISGFTLHWVHNQYRTVDIVFCCGHHQPTCHVIAHALFSAHINMHHVMFHLQLFI